MDKTLVDANPIEFFDLAHMLPTIFRRRNHNPGGFINPMLYVYNRVWIQTAETSIADISDTYEHATFQKAAINQHRM